MNAKALAALSAPSSPVSSGGRNVNAGMMNAFRFHGQTTLLLIFILCLERSLSEPTPTGDTSPPPSHTCRVVLRGNTAGTGKFSLSQFSIRCEPSGIAAGSASGGTADGGEQAKVTVRLGRQLLTHIETVGGGRQAPNLLTGVTLGAEPRPVTIPQLPSASFTSPANSGICTNHCASEDDDWGFDILDVPHLRLVDSSISGVPLSSTASLLQCLNCTRLTIQNMTLRNLASSNQSGCTAPTYGAVRVTSLQSARLEGLNCSGVRAALGWGCILLQVRPEAVVAIRSSSFVGNSVGDYPDEGPAALEEAGAPAESEGSAEPPAEPKGEVYPRDLAAAGVLPGPWRLTSSGACTAALYSSAPPSPPSDDPYAPIDDACTSDSGAGRSEVLDLKALMYCDDKNEETFQNYGAVLIVYDLNGGQSCSGGAAADRGTFGVLVENSIFTENAGGCGAGLAVRSRLYACGIFGRDTSCCGQNVHLDFINCTITHNRASKEGGGIYVRDMFLNSAVAVAVNGSSTISFNTAQDGGGGVNLDTITISQLSIVDSEVSYNTAGSSYGGGGILVSASDRIAAVTISNSSLSGNVAHDGGAMYLCAQSLTPEQYGIGLVKLDGASKLCRNSAVGLGGVLYIRVTTSMAGIRVEGGSLVQENIAGRQGGAIYVVTEQNITGLHIGGGSRLIRNGAKGGHGGAVYLEAKQGGVGAVDIQHAEVSGNYADYRQAYGGGIYIYSSEDCPPLTMQVGEQAVFAHNTAGGHGGAIYMACPYSLTKDAGKGVNLTGSMFINNTAQAGGGGAVYVNQRSATIEALIVVNTFLVGNTAGCHGGAIYVDLTDLKSERSQRNGINVTDGIVGEVLVLGQSVLANNSAKAVCNGSSGGAIYLGTYRLNKPIVISEGSRIINNSAAGDGGAIYIPPDTPQRGLKVSGGSVLSHNSAKARGGVVLLHAYKWDGMMSEFIVQLDPGTVVSGNEAGSGGFLYVNVYEGVNLKIDGSNITGNNAHLYGGAICLMAATYLNASILGGSVVASNAVASEGGGTGGAFYLQPTGEGKGVNFTIAGASNISNNWATSSGGAIHLYVTSANVGRVLIDEESVISNNSIISKNGDLGRHGGALFILVSGGNISEVTITGRSQVINNNAGGNGGAIYLRTQSDAGQFPLVKCDNASTVASNNAGGKGGGIFASARVVHVLVQGGCQLTGNTVQDSGGALAIDTTGAISDTRIYTATASSVKIADRSVVSRNYGQNGGAIHIQGFARLNFTDGSTLSYNEAKYDGGVAALTQLPSELRVESCNITGNRAARGSGGAFFLKTEKPVAMSSSDCPLCVLGSTNIGMSSTSFIGNSASAADGGVLFLEPDETCCDLTKIALNITDSQFVQNTAMGAGGAIAYKDASNTVLITSVSNSSFRENTAGTVTGDFTSSANFGGALLLWREPADASTVLTNSCQLDVRGSVFEANNCNGGTGGAVMLISCSSRFEGCNFTANHATLSGGAIASLHVARTTATLGLNLAAANSMDILGSSVAQGSSSSTPEHRRRRLRHDHPGDQKQMALPAVKRQLAADVAVEDYSVAPGVETFQKLEAPQAAVRPASGPRSVGGLDLCGLNGAKLNWYVVMAGCNFSRNTADLEYGGAVYFYSSANGGQVRMARCNFTENRAAQQHGGAAFLAMNGAGSGFHLASSHMDSNVAQLASAGALYGLIGAQACGSLMDVSMDDNRAFTSGGACVMDVRRAGALRMEGLTASHNKAFLGDAGALQLQVKTGAFVNVSGCSFTDNQAAVNGGALLLDGACGSDLILENSMLARNRAAGGSGGAIYTMYGAKVTTGQQQANAGAFGAPPTPIYMPMSPCQPTSVMAPSEVVIEPMLSLCMLSLEQNAAGQQGGAVYVAPASTLVMSNLSMSSNVACKGGGSVAAEDCASLSLTNSALHSGRTAGSGGGLFAQGCRRILLEFVNLVGNEARGSGGGLAVAGPTINDRSRDNTSSSNSGAGQKQGSSKFDFTSMVLHRVQVSGNTVSEAVDLLASGVCTATDGGSMSSSLLGGKGQGGGLLVTGRVVGALSRCDLSQPNDALFGTSIASTQRCFPKSVNTSQPATKVMDSLEMSVRWQGTWPELDALAALQCWVLQLSDTMLPPVATSEDPQMSRAVSAAPASQNLPLWVEDFLASAVQVKCTERQRIEDTIALEEEGTNDALWAPITKTVATRLADSRKRVRNATYFAGYLLSLVNNGTISTAVANGSVDLANLAHKRFASLTKSLADCVRPAAVVTVPAVSQQPQRAAAAANASQPQAITNTSQQLQAAATDAALNASELQAVMMRVPYMGLPPAYIGLQLSDGSAAESSVVVAPRLQLQAGAPFNLIAYLYDMFQQRLTLDVARSTITLALRPQPLDDPSTATAAADSSTPWQDPNVADLDPGLNKSLTVPVRNGTATWTEVTAYAWPGRYNLVLVLNTNDTSYVKVASLNTEVEVLPCSPGETLDLIRSSKYKISYTGCRKCAAGQYGLWQDRRPLLADLIPSRAVEEVATSTAAAAAAVGSGGGGGDGGGGSAESSGKSLAPYLKKMNESINADDYTCRSCPANALCLGGAIIVPVRGFWHSAANSTRIHACPNPSACAAKDETNSRFPQWLEDMVPPQQADRRTKILAWCQLAWYSSVVPGEAARAAYAAALASSSGAENATAAIALASDYGSGGGGATAAAEDDPAAASSAPAAVLLNRGLYASRVNFTDVEAFSCLLFGLPPGDPDSYTQLQCNEGYTGNLCAGCVPGYYLDQNFECNSCPSRAHTIGLGLISFFFSVVLVLFTTMTNLAEGFAVKKANSSEAAQIAAPNGGRDHDDRVELGDVLKVIVLHIQYLVIVTRLSVDYPDVIMRCQAALGAVTGAENYLVYSPNCVLPDSNSDRQALIQWLAGILTPCAVTLMSMALWTLRYGYPFRGSMACALKVRAHSMWNTLARIPRTVAARPWRYRSPPASNSIGRLDAAGGSPDDFVATARYGNTPFAVACNLPLSGPHDSAYSQMYGGGRGIGLCAAFRDIQLAELDTFDAIAAELPTPDAGADGMSAAAAAVDIAATGAAVTATAVITTPMSPAASLRPPLPMASSAALVVDLSDIEYGDPVKVLGPPPLPFHGPTGGIGRGYELRGSLLRARSARSAAAAFIGGGDGSSRYPVDESLDGLSDSPTKSSGGSGGAGSHKAAIGDGFYPALRTAGSGNLYLPASHAPPGLLRGAASVGNGAAGGGSALTPAQFYYRSYNSDAWHRRTPKTLSQMGSIALNDTKRALHKLRTFAVHTQQASQATFMQVDKAMSLREQLGVVLMAAVFILYPSWAHAALSTFACYRVDDGRGPFPEAQQATWPYGYWVRNMAMQCYSGEHLRAYVPAGLAAVLVFCALPPLASLLFVWRVRGRLDDPHVRKVYGFLYKRYKPRYIWWETVLQLETLILVTVEVLGRALSVDYQALLLLAVFTVIALVNVSCAPLLSRLLIIMEFVSLGTLSLTITISLYFSMDEGLYPAVENALAVIIIILNACVMFAFVCIAGRHYWPSAFKRVAPKAQAVLRKISSIGSSTAGGSNAKAVAAAAAALKGGSGNGGGGSSFWSAMGRRIAFWRRDRAYYYAAADTASGSGSGSGSSGGGGGGPMSQSEATEARALERLSPGGFSDGMLVNRRESDSPRSARQQPHQQQQYHQQPQQAGGGGGGGGVSVCLDDRRSRFSEEPLRRQASKSSRVGILLDG